MVRNPDRARVWCLVPSSSQRFWLRSKIIKKSSNIAFDIVVVHLNCRFGVIHHDLAYCALEFIGIGFGLLQAIRDRVALCQIELPTSNFEHPTLNRRPENELKLGSGSSVALILHA